MNFNKQTIIGIAGVPGSGKTYYCNNVLSNQIENVKIIPMDGYHIYRKDLNEEGVRRRGAPFTFDFVRLRKDLIKLRETGEGAFPAFDHAVKDPEENAIIVTKNDKVIIIEGLYLFLKELDLTGIFDYKLFIDRKFDEKVIGARHFNCGIEDSLEKGIQRAIDNDKVNAEYIMENSDFSNVKFIK